MSSSPRVVVEAFLAFLHRQTGPLSVAGNEEIAVASELLARSFEIDERDIQLGGRSHLLPRLEDLVTSSQPPVASSSSTSSTSRKEADLEDDPKFRDFVEKLKAKGYFSGVQAGSPAYEERYNNAKKRFSDRVQKQMPSTQEQPVSEEKRAAAEKLKAEGNDLLHANSWDAAVAKYTEAITLDPQNAVYYSNRAAANSYLRKYDDVIQDCLKAVSIDPKFAKAYARLGSAYEELEQFDNAINAYSQAVSSDPANPRYQEMLQNAKNRKDSQSPPPQANPFGMDFGALFGQLSSDPAFQSFSSTILNGLMQNNAPASPPSSPPPSDPSPPPTEETEESDDTPPSMNFGNMFGSNMLPFANMFENDPELMHELGELSNEPEFASIREEFAQEGPSALMRHLNNPRVAQLFSRISSRMMPQMMSSLGSLFGGGSGRGGGPGGMFS